MTVSPCSGQIRVTTPVSGAATCTVDRPGRSTTIAGTVIVRSKGPEFDLGQLHAHVLLRRLAEFDRFGLDVLVVGHLLAGGFAGMVMAILFTACAPGASPVAVLRRGSASPRGRAPPRRRRGHRRASFRMVVAVVLGVSRTGTVEGREPPVA